MCDVCIGFYIDIKIFYHCHTFLTTKIDIQYNKKMASFASTSGAPPSPRRPFVNHELLQKSMEHRSALGLGRARTNVPNQDVDQNCIRRNLTNRQELQGHRYYHAPLRPTSSVTTSSANPCANFVWSKEEVDKKMNEKIWTIHKMYKGNESTLHSKDAHDHDELSEDTANRRRVNEQKYMRLNNSRKTMEIIQGAFSDIDSNNGNSNNKTREKTLDIMPTTGVITKPFNRLGGRNKAEVEAEMRVKTSIQEAVKQKNLLEAKATTQKTLFQSDSTAYFGKETVLEKVKVGVRRPQIQKKQTAIYAKHLKSQIGSW